MKLLLNYQRQKSKNSFFSCLLCCIILTKLVGFMKKLMEIKNLEIEKEKTKIVQNIDFIIYEGINVFLCGAPSSGKTTLLKAIAGMIKYKGHITKNCNIEVILDECNFTKDTILEELNYDALNDHQKKIVNKFITKTTLKKNPFEVEEKVQKLVLLCQTFLKEPQLLFMDNILSYFDRKTLDKINSYIKKNKITLVNVSTRIENALNYPYMVVLDKGSIAIEGKTLQVLEQEKILKRLGIGLPFYVDLSIQLRLYGLIDQIYFTKEELEGALWK